MARQGKAGEVRHGLAGPGEVWHGKAGKARRGRAWLGKAGFFHFTIGE